MDAFLGKVVRKDLAFLVKGGLPVPTYVLEYLLGQYCASDDEQAIEEGIEKVKTVIRNNYVNRADAEQIKGQIREKGKFRIIDKVNVTLNERADEYQASFANLGLTKVPIGSQYVTQNPKLLSGNGVWCIVTIGYIQGVLEAPVEMAPTAISSAARPPVKVAILFSSSSLVMR